MGCIPAAFILALFYLGGELGQSRLGLPSSITGVYQGLLLFFLLLCDVWIFYKPVWVRLYPQRIAEMSAVAALIAATLNAGTPLLIAGIGILIHRKKAGS